MVEEARDFRPLTEHLTEIRVRIFRVLGVFALLMCLAWRFNDAIYNFLLAPVFQNPEFASLKFVIVDVTDRFWITFKVITIAAFTGGLPVYLYEFYAFIAPALKKSEKAIMKSVLFFSPILFLVGAFLWLEWLLPETLAYLLKMGPQNNVQDLLGLGSFLSFALWMAVLFGALFQMPLILLSLVKVGLVSTLTLAKYRKEALLVLAAISAIATPSPDAFTMLALWAPLVVLYEGVIWIGKIIERREVASDKVVGQVV
jgi:sec-independent protein translocase protein TatC